MGAHGLRRIQMFDLFLHLTHTLMALPGQKKLLQQPYLSWVGDLLCLRNFGGQPRPQNTSGPGHDVVPVSAYLTSIWHRPSTELTLPQPAFLRPLTNVSGLL